MDQHVGTEEEEEEEEEECRCSWRKSFPLGASPMHIEQDDHFLSDDAGEKLRAAQAIQAECKEKLHMCKACATIGLSRAPMVLCTD